MPLCNDQNAVNMLWSESWEFKLQLCHKITVGSLSMTLNHKLLDCILP